MRFGVRTILKKLLRRGRPQRLRARRFLNKGISVDQFLSQLTAEGARYAVLRWFDSLPEVEPGEDIDLLVADDDLARVEPLLSLSPADASCQKVDLYSESGIRGTSFRKVPYFSQELASKILGNAVLLHDRYKIPSPADHFDSLAFHAVYHKGEASGLPRNTDELASPAFAEHRYLETLTRLLPHATAPVELSLEGLDRYLSEKGLRPRADTLDRYQAGNAWLRAQQAASRQDIGSLAGLIVFSVREAALGHVPEIERAINRHGMEILRVIPLSGQQQERVRRAVRGGNWGRGPFPKSGGDPALLIIAYDYAQSNRPTPDGQLINRRAIKAKYEVRDLIHARLPRGEQFNPMHSSDNGWHSLDCLEALEDPSCILELRTQIERIDRQLDAPWPEIQELRRGRRARTVIVDHPVHGRTVAKLFRPGAKRFLEREIMARQELSGVPLIPRLLDHADNWFLSPLYADTRQHVRRVLRGTSELQLTYPTARAVAAFVQELRKRHLFLLDLTSHNLITDAEAGLLILDLEFLQRYRELPPLEQDYTVCGEALEDDVDVPVITRDKRRSQFAKSIFHPAITGQSIRDLSRPNPSAFGRMKAAAVQAWWHGISMWRLVALRFGGLGLRPSVVRPVAGSNVRKQNGSAALHSNPQFTRTDRVWIPRGSTIAAGARSRPWTAPINSSVLGEGPVSIPER